MDDKKESWGEPDSLIDSLWERFGFYGAVIILSALSTAILAGVAGFLYQLWTLA